LPLAQTTLKYLKSLGSPEAPNNAAEYLQLVEWSKKATGKDGITISHDAWLWCRQGDIETFDFSETCVDNLWHQFNILHPALSISHIQKS